MTCSVLLHFANHCKRTNCTLQTIANAHINLNPTVQTTAYWVYISDSKYLGLSCRMVWCQYPRSSQLYKSSVKLGVYCEESRRNGWGIIWWCSYRLFGTTFDKSMYVEARFRWSSVLSWGFMWVCRACHWMPCSSQCAHHGCDRVPCGSQRVLFEVTLMGSGEVWILVYSLLSGYLSSWNATAHGRPHKYT